MAKSSDKFDASGSAVSQCAYCGRLLDSGGFPLACTAFPAGISDAILRNEVDHRQPVDGDQGQQFQLRKGLAPGAGAIIARTLDKIGGKP
jgi:hypothetical protein